MSEASSATPSTRRVKLRNKVQNATAIAGKSCRRVANNAIVIMDIDGQITDCNCAAAELLNRNADELPGEPLMAMLSGLPFAPDTPGYNLAYAGFHAADEHWLPGTARLTDGSRIAVDIAFSTAKTNRQRFIVLTLRPSLKDTPSHAQLPI